ncbi:MAG: GGDEF domain-containing protein, partial [Candidatus Caldatribacteriaceae bacterium]
ALKEREEKLKMEKKRLERPAQLDVFTNLPNRRFLEKWVGEAVRGKERFALVFVDLDGFKKVKDLLGHPEGDILLKKIASWFEHKIRKEDVVVRYGVDEFCFLFPGLGREETEEIMRRILVNFEKESFMEGLTLGFSYGIAVYPEEAKDMDELLEHSDGKMYAPKRKNLLLIGELLDRFFLRRKFYF